MATDTLQLDKPTLVNEQGRWFITVPWGHADELHRHLHNQGYPSTLCLDYGVRQARFELWPGKDPAGALAVVEQLCAHQGHHGV